MVPKILDNDVSEGVEYLKNEDEQWRTNSMWYKGFFDDVQQSSSKPVNAKTFNHRRHVAYRHKKALIRAETMSEVVNDVYRTHKMPMNHRGSRAMEKEVRTTDLSVRPVCEPMQGSKMAGGHRMWS